MSNTHKTKPLWVKMASNDPDARKHVGLEEVHEHANGQECDLPEKPKVRDANGQSTTWGDTNCHWSWVYVGVQLCGCTICTAQDQRRAMKRSARRRSHDDYHRLSRTLRGVDLEDEDAILDSLDVVDTRYKVPSTW